MKRRRHKREQVKKNKRNKILSFWARFFFLTAFAKHERAKSLHEILGPVIVVGNIFSIFPVQGIFSKKIENLKFRIYYPVAIYSSIVQFCLITELILLFVFLSKVGLKFFMVGKLGGKS